MGTIVKKLLIVAILSLAPAAEGCVVVSDTVDPGDPIDASFSLTWTTIDAWTGFAVDCHDVGADSVRVIADNMDTGDAFVDLFGCDAQHGRTAPVTAGDYAVTVDLVRCGFDETCSFAPVIAGTSLPDRFSIFDPAVIDLGHFDFEVN